ncbi:MAG: prephenate dehydrogenase [Janthinobacterium lividum]
MKAAGAPPGFQFNKVVVVGLGLIGSSLVRALRQASSGNGQIIGIERDASGAAQAQALGVVEQAAALDDYAASATAFAAADIVVLAVPVAQTALVLSRIVPHLGERTLITDVGSTKANVEQAARAALGPAIARFVPAHPATGSEAHGIGAGNAAMFVDRPVVVCRLAENSAVAVDRIKAMWRATGAYLVERSVQEHDRTFAATSHLPHLLAAAYMLRFGETDNAYGAADTAGADLAPASAAVSPMLDLAAGGFRDFTRIAASSPEMWRDICLGNRDALLAELAAFQQRLARISQALTTSDANALESLFAQAAALRSAWMPPAPGESAGTAAQALAEPRVLGDASDGKPSGEQSGKPSDAPSGVPGNAPGGEPSGAPSGEPGGTRRNAPDTSND